ncbi:MULTISPECIES: 23S rRNA (pseudouridine(1915)-N(3))-methyltransferase RlmH [unclassified Facklamia]|uniref:23S rRNA (pseudouridine(1915)-N(3))-methyltransferase RlmH n=1 Tax=Aerococcaceae TaxID=186827 RepID=UPI0013B910DC|nr:MULTISPECIES: 23S rRNA (pseudouridine(1915)-N(3))-methyltransferase RlmH [unclassified Facklamia]MBS4461613.1 23S rRNA (pseudouridine(1915)-N(3))-methyltransferase RlmH [Aerococcaceae bacterium zg-B36]NEW63905.1 23S rRNA (pseudouridine(1915)-N(3))-methyltransferase RlmH [Facklamia sp. 252]NEW67376.1 23S rRNA (pseudouridine(1915)-N(3))-methyltransferase RlmH [Facklamia sp. 253]QQD65252.1 23S rRNA (pseudouridine(1915)-N(3))-methyltransferase RlmH [Aerococcaceae bacterium zg-252]
MNIEIICVGKLKEKYLKQGIDEYLKRLQAYAKVSVIEVSDESTDENMSEVEINQVLEKEADKIAQRLDEQRKVIVLAIEGKLISSEELAQQLNDYAIYGDSKVTFIIGGSLGLAERLKRRANLRVSFGRITLPHQLMRLILVEQIYRAFRIINGHAYHK